MPNGQILTLPAWIPGSYMIRDFAKDIVTLQAYDEQGNALTSKKVDKQTWQIAPCDGQLKVVYRVYAFDLSVRSAYINDEFAFFNGTSVFLKAEQHKDSLHTVDIAIPSETRSQWQIATAMDKDDLYYAKDYEELIDQPVIIGDLDSRQFNVGGVDFDFVFVGDHHSDMDRIVRDLAPICQHHLDLFGPATPIKRYLFMTLVCDQGFGGLEHRNSTVLQFTRSELPSKQDRDHISDGYRSFLALCSHEFFHTWNVKRIRPAEFMDLDLCRETYSEQLWIYEGFTSYFDDITLVRTGLIEPESYLELIGITLTRLARNPGMSKQTVTQSSFDAWTRFYKQDASAANNIVSYYAKGAIVALCLDLKVRLTSNHKVTLFDVIQSLWKDYGELDKGTEIDVVQSILKNKFEIDLTEFIHSCIYTTEPLPTSALLKEFGVELQLNARNNPNDKGGKPSTDAVKVDFGAQFKGEPIGVKITQVIENRAAYKAGLQVGDLVLSVNQWQVNNESLQQRLDDNVDSESVALHILRDGKLKAMQMPISAAAKDTVYLHTKDETLRSNWLLKP